MPAGIASSEGNASPAEGALACFVCESQHSVRQRASKAGSALLLSRWLSRLAVCEQSENLCALSQNYRSASAQDRRSLGTCALYDAQRDTVDARLAAFICALHSRTLF